MQVYNSQGLMKVARDKGWVAHGKSSSHQLLKHPVEGKIVSIPKHKGLIPYSTQQRILDKLKLKEEESSEKKHEKQKIQLGKNKSKITLHPPIKETVEKIKKYLREDADTLNTVPDKVGDSAPLSNAEMAKAYNFPEGVLGDPKARSSLKAFAYQILQLRIESEEFLEEKVSGFVVGNATPEQLAKYHKELADGKKWLAKNKPHHKNIIDHYNQATEDEKKAGTNWYQDAHHMTRHIANDTKTPMTAMAGLVANYSPQTHWAENLTTASKVARTKEPLGGPGSGVFASKKQKVAAGRMLAGEHYDNVLVGHKVKAFGHLIEHGDSQLEKKQHVVVDRHAFSVATGKRVTDSAFSQSGLKSKKNYEHVADQYRLAAKKLSAQHQTEILPHHVQATTWLVRQRLNQKEENEKHGHNKVAAMARSATNKWDAYRQQHHPGLTGQMPGVGYLMNKRPE